MIQPPISYSSVVGRLVGRLNIPDSQITGMVGQIKGFNIKFAIFFNLNNQLLRYFRLPNIGKPDERRHRSGPIGVA
jgi:hypothetical protein